MKNIDPVQLKPLKKLGNLASLEIMGIGRHSPLSHAVLVRVSKIESLQELIFVDADIPSGQMDAFKGKLNGLGKLEFKRCRASPDVICTLHQVFDRLEKLKMSNCGLSASSLSGMKIKVDVLDTSSNQLNASKMKELLRLKDHPLTKLTALNICNTSLDGETVKLLKDSLPGLKCLESGCKKLDFGSLGEGESSSFFESVDEEDVDFFDVKTREMVAVE